MRTIALLFLYWAFSGHGRRVERRTQADSSQDSEIAHHCKKSRSERLASLKHPKAAWRDGVCSPLNVIAKLLLAATPAFGWQLLGARRAQGLPSRFPRKSFVLDRCAGQDNLDRLYLSAHVLSRSSVPAMQFISPNFGQSSDEEQPTVGQMFDPDFGDEFDEPMPMMYLHDADDDDDDDVDGEPTSSGVISPFAPERGDVLQDDGEIWPLTPENVERALDEVRPFLINDGGNVKLREIDGPEVVLELEGSCAGCISSAMTMRMGIERKLMERIPEIAEVRQMLPETVDLSVEGVDSVLDEIRPFITIADKAAKLEVVDIGGPEIAPIVKLRLASKISVVKSVKDEIRSRIQNHFSNPGLRIEWELS